MDFPRFFPRPFQPIGGMVKAVPAAEIPIECSPDMSNCSVINGLLRKRMGYAQFPSGGSALTGGGVTGIYSTQNDENQTVMLAVTPTKVYVWNDGTNTWTLLTGTDLTAQADDPVAFETSQNSIVFSQGIDPVKRADISAGIPASFASLNANCPAARFLTRFTDRLILGHTLESGDNKPYRIRRSVSGDHANWTGVGSGFVDMAEFPYHLRGVRKLITQMAVYTEHSIHLATKTGMASGPFSLDAKSEVGVYVERSLASIPGIGHVFVGNDNFYAFNGSQEQPIGSPVRDEIFNAITPNAVRQGFSETLVETQEYMTFLPVSGSLYPSKAWVYNWGRNVWYPWTVPNALCGTLHRNDDGITIDELIGTIDQQLYEIDSVLLQGSYPRFLTGHLDSKVYDWSLAYSSDNGAAINCLWTSKDFTSKDLSQDIPPSEIILRLIEIRYIDSGVDTVLDFFFSINGGTTWDGPYPITLAGGAGGERTAKITKQVASGSEGRIRFKFHQSSTSASFRISLFTPVFELGETLTP